MNYEQTVTLGTAHILRTVLI